MYSSFLARGAANIGRKKAGASVYSSSSRGCSVCSRLGDRISNAAGAADLISSVYVLPQRASLLPLRVPFVRAMSHLASAGQHVVVTLPELEATVPALQQKPNSGICSSFAAIVTQMSTASAVAMAEMEYNTQRVRDVSAISALKFSSPNIRETVNKDRGLELLVCKIVAEMKKANQGKVSTRRLLLPLRQYDGVLKSSALLPILRQCMSKRGQSQIAEEVLDIMRRRGVRPHTALIVAHLQLLCNDYKLHEASEVLERVAKDSKEDPKACTLKTSMVNIVFRAAVLCGKVSVFNTVLQLMKNHRLEPDVMVHVEMMRMMGVYQDRRKVRAKWAEVTYAFRHQPPVEMQGALVFALAHVDSVWEARLALEDMKEQMRKSGWEPAGSAVGEQEEGALDDCFDVDGRYPRDKTEALDWGYSMTDHLKRAYHEVLAAAARDGSPMLVKELLQERKDLGLTPYSFAREYNLHLEAAARAGSVEEIEKWMGMMRKLKVPVRVNSYAALISWHCNEDSLAAPDDKLGSALVMLNKALDQKTINKAMLGSIIHGCLRKRSHTHLVTMIQRMVQGGLHRSSWMYAAAFTFIGMNITAGSVDTGSELARIRHLVKQMRQMGVFHSPASLHAEVWALGQGGAIQRMLYTVRQRRNVKDHHRWLMLNVLIYNTALHACCRHEKWEEMHELLEMMRADGSYLLDVGTNNSLRHQFTFGDADLASALRLLNALTTTGRTADLFAFNFLIHVVSHAGDLAAGLSLLSKMEEMQVRPDSQTLRTLFFYAARHGRLDVMEHVVERMLREESVIIDNDILFVAVSAYVKSGRRRDASRAANVIGSRMLPPDSPPTSRTPQPETTDIRESSKDATRSPPPPVNLERLKELIERGGDDMGGDLPRSQATEIADFEKCKDSPT